VAGAWATFLANAGITMTDEEMAAMFPAEPDPQAVADERYQYAHMIRPTTRFVPDVVALRAVHVLVGLGEASAGQLCDRTSRALAGELGTEPTMFPGGHVGFLEEPAAFAERLRAVLDRRR